MASKMKKILAGAASLAALQSAAAAPVAAEAAQTDGFEIVQNEETVYDKVANVQGSFRFDQDVLSP